MVLTVRCLLVFLFIFQVSLKAQEGFKVISGVLTENLSSEIPVLVVGDVFISPGSTITFEAGTVILFEGFTGLHVQGTLYVKGTPERPVVFTSKNDRQYNPESTVDPAPFDWNGIDVYDGAIGTSFQDCSIKYSVYGIRAQTGHFKIVNAQFSSNGKADITVNGERLEPVPNVPFSYGLSVVAPLPAPQELPEIQPSVSDNLNTIAVDTMFGGSTKPKRRTASPALMVLRYSGLLIGLGSAGLSAWYYKSSYKPLQRKFDDISVLSEKNMLKYSSNDWVNSKNERDRAFALCIGGAGGAVAGIGVFSLSFAF